MLRFQAELPRLPVPELSETCALYLRLVSPLLTETELAATGRAVEDFRRRGGQGEALQRRLLRWSRRPDVDNWLDPFWDDWYLCDGAPLVVNVSPGFALAGSDRPQVARAARLLAAAARFEQLVDEERLEPELEGGVPRCMREYGRLLASTRIPGATRDSSEPSPGARHVVVARGNRLHALDVLDEHGRIYAVEDLERALQRIVDDSTFGLPVGVLTTTGRRAWAHAREEHLLYAGRPAREALAAVESAILLLALDGDPAPPRPRSREAARLFLHGDGRNRWFDTSVQLVVAPNGVAGICMEHAGFDGITLVRFAEFLVAHEGSPAVTARPGAPLTARELRFEPVGPLGKLIEKAERDVDALLRRTDVAVLDFHDFGRDVLVDHGLSPDGFVQMAFQLANFRLTGQTSSTYESVDMKRFLHGRTEAMRSVSPESVAFVRSLRDGRDSTARTEGLLREAVSSHAATVRRCKSGHGIERHLLGLRRMLEPGEPLPALFTDQGYGTLSRSVLSTSSLPSSPGVELSCFGPVVDEGLGLSYTVHDDAVCCVASSFHGLADAFAEALGLSLLEMRALLR